MHSRNYLNLFFQAAGGKKKRFIILTFTQNNSNKQWKGNHPIP